MSFGTGRIFHTFCKNKLKTNSVLNISLAKAILEMSENDSENEFLKP